MKTLFVHVFGSRILANAVVAVVAERSGSAFSVAFSVAVQYVVGNECKSISSRFDTWMDATVAAGNISDGVARAMSSDGDSA